MFFSVFKKFSRPGVQNKKLKLSALTGKMREHSVLKNQAFTNFCCSFVNFKMSCLFVLVTWCSITVFVKTKNASFAVDAEKNVLFWIFGRSLRFFYHDQRTPCSSLKSWLCSESGVRANEKSVFVRVCSRPQTLSKTVFSNTCFPTSLRLQF